MPNDNNSMGLAGGLMSKRKEVGDTAAIPAPIRLMMLKRKQEKKDTTPVYSKEDAIQDLKSGYQPKAPQDTSKIKMAHNEWLKHINELGYELKKKSQ